MCRTSFEWVRGREGMSENIFPCHSPCMSSQLYGRVWKENQEEQSDSWVDKTIKDNNQNFLLAPFFMSFLLIFFSLSFSCLLSSIFPGRQRHYSIRPLLYAWKSAYQNNSEWILMPTMKISHWFCFLSSSIAFLLSFTYRSMRK